MKYSAAILALLTGIAGWYYLFYSRGVQTPSGLADPHLAARRIFLRKVGGGIMLLLGIGLYLGFWAADEASHPVWFIVIWVAVLVLMAALIVLALIDIQLTVRIRRQQLKRNRGTFLDPSGPT